MRQHLNTVFIVDDDPLCVDAMETALRRADFQTRCFPSADEFMTHFDPAWRGCILLDIDMPGMNGLELQEKLNEIGTTLPILFITSTADVPTAVAAMRRGAIDLIPKPINVPTLLEKVEEAIALDGQRLIAAQRRMRATSLVQSLTPREKEVIELVVAGLANKQIAVRLAISEKTVEVHRARGMQKMEADSMADLVRAWMSVSRPAA